MTFFRQRIIPLPHRLDTWLGILLVALVVALWYEWTVEQHYPPTPLVASPAGQGPTRTMELPGNLEFE